MVEILLLIIVVPTVININITKETILRKDSGKSHHKSFP